MKIFEITSSPTPLISEGKVDINALMSLKKIADTGVISNKFEELVICKFAMLLKNGQFYNDAAPVFTTAVTVSPALLSELRQMPKEKLKLLAS